MWPKPYASTENQSVSLNLDKLLSLLEDNSQNIKAVLYIYTLKGKCLSTPLPRARLVALSQKGMDDNRVGMKS